MAEQMEQQSTKPAVVVAMDASKQAENAFACK